MSSVACDILFCCSSVKYPKVLMLWSLSASFIIKTLKSLVVAKNIFLMLSASLSCLLWYFIMLSFVTPSTSMVTSSPNFCLKSSSVTFPVSSTSCRSDAAIVVASCLSSARMYAVSNTCCM